MAKKGKTKKGKKGPRTIYQSPPIEAIKCPHCGAYGDSKATGTKGAVQFRQCRRGACRASFTVARKRILVDEP